MVLKARTAAQWGNISIVSHQWLEDSALQGVLCTLKGYTLLKVKPTAYPAAQILRNPLYFTIQGSCRAHTCSS